MAHKIIGTLAGVPVVKVSSVRIRESEQQEGLYYYNVRDDDDSAGNPTTLEKHVLVNHYATVVTTEPIHQLEYNNEYNLELIGLTPEMVQFIRANEA